MAEASETHTTYETAPSQGAFVGVLAAVLGGVAILCALIGITLALMG